MRHFYGWRMIFIPLIGIPALLLFPYVIMLLWNALLPGIFHVAEITFWQALGLLILSRILFGGFTGHFRHGQRGCHGQSNHMGPWRNRWAKMSEEERAKMKDDWKNRCRNYGHDEPESTKV